MLEEHGIVTEVSDQFVVIQTQRVTACGHCASKQSCGHVDFQPGQPLHHFKVPHNQHVTLKVGDEVVVGLAEQALLNSSIVLYLLPLVGLFAGALGYEGVVSMARLPHSELLSILSSLLGFGVGLIGVKRLTLKMVAKSSYQPVILQVTQR